MIANNNKNKKNLSVRGLLRSFFLWALLLAAVIFLAAANFRIKQRRDKLAATQGSLEKEIQNVENKNEEIKNKISALGSKEYLEKIAREQFNLKAPGEEVVVISKDESGSPKNNAADSAPAPKPKNNFIQNLFSKFKEVFDKFSQ